MRGVVYCSYKMSAQLELDLVELLDKHPNLRSKEFLRVCDKVAACKWNTTRNLNSYQQFVKSNMKKVIDSFPSYDHKTRMGVISEMWKGYKPQLA